MLGKRKNRELSYMQTSNIIDSGSANRGSKVKLTGAQFKQFCQRVKGERQSATGDRRRTALDKLVVPSEVEALFPNKVKVYEQMRELEESMNSFMR